MKRHERGNEKKPFSPEEIEYYNDYYIEQPPVFEIGDFKVFSFPCSYVYVYKNISINELVGLNKAHVEALVNDIRPENPQQGFLFDQAKSKMEQFKDLIK